MEWIALNSSARMCIGLKRNRIKSVHLWNWSLFYIPRLKKTQQPKSVCRGVVMRQKGFVSVCQSNYHICGRESVRVWERRKRYYLLFYLAWHIQVHSHRWTRRSWRRHYEGAAWPGLHHIFLLKEMETLWWHTMTQHKSLKQHFNFTSIYFGTVQTPLPQAKCRRNERVLCLRSWVHPDRSTILNSPSIRRMESVVRWSLLKLNAHMPRQAFF